MANRQIKDLPAVTTVADADILHINTSNLDRKITNSDYEANFINRTKANNTEALAGVSDTKLMTAAKTKLVLDQSVAQTAFITLDAAATLSLPNNYFLSSNDTFTLPNVTGVTEGKIIMLGKPNVNNPIVAVDGGNGEVIVISEGVTDTSITYDIPFTIGLVFNGVNWEII